MKAHISMRSTNMKTGPIPVSTTCRKSCPPTCPMRGSKGGCYGEYGNARMVWNKVSDGRFGGSWDAFCEDVAGMPANQLWRHNQVGDLPGRGGKIDESMLIALVHANKGKRGFTYTHYDPEVGDNASLILYANDQGFTINLSADCPAHADRLAEMGIAPVVTVLPHGFPNLRSETPEGRRINVCLAERVEYMTCALCKKCQNTERTWIVGFRAHGSCYKRVDAMFERAARRWRRINSRSVGRQVDLGHVTNSAIARALGYRSMCGDTLRKVACARNASACTECAPAGEASEKRLKKVHIGA